MQLQLSVVCKVATEMVAHCLKDLEVKPCMPVCELNIVIQQLSTR